MTKYREFDVAAPDYQPMSYYSSEMEDPGGLPGEPPGFLRDRRQRDRRFRSLITLIDTGETGPVAGPVSPRPAVWSVIWRTGQTAHETNGGGAT